MGRGCSKLATAGKSQFPDPVKGTAINDLGVGPEEIKKKNLEALLQEKKINTEGVPGKK